MTEYVIEYTSAARRALAAPVLPLRVIDAVVAFANGELARHPKRVGKPLSGAMEGHWAARRGNYRVIYTIDDERRIVRVVGIALRGDIYIYRPR